METWGEREFLGRVTWELLHGFSDETVDVGVVLKLVRWLCQEYPCRVCRSSLNDIERDLHSTTSTGLIFELHNRVNRRLGRPVASPDVLQRYQCGVSWETIVPSLEAHGWYRVHQRVRTDVKAWYHVLYWKLQHPMSCPSVHQCSDSDCSHN